jgi:cbb3-type cytochrome c oxidase subunit I
VVPRVCGRRLWSERIGAQTVILLDQVVLAGVVLLLLGRTQGIPGAELIWPIDLLLLNVMLMVAQNVFATVARRATKPLAPSLWYYLAALVFLPLAYGFGNLAASWYYGVDQQVVAGFGVAGTTAALTMMGLGTAYYVLPKASGLPIYSARLATMGFWSLVFASPWVGQAGAILGPGPDELETVAITFAVGLVIPALCVVANFWGTMRDHWEKFVTEPAVRFVIGGVTFLLLSSLMFAAGSLRTFQNIVGHTTWDVATQTALVGGLGLFLLGLVYHQFPKIIGRALYSTRWVGLQFWVTSVGIFTVVLATAVAGLVQGDVQVVGVQTNQPLALGEGWFTVLLATRPLYILRIAGGGLVAAGLFLFVANLIRTSSSGADAAVEPPPAAEPVAVGVSA